ncbi:hypothetical protein [Bilophila wadsworthia]|uniref:hypothetical protein n=1 Tax=Bilophila wadsworthia TaxID=35833 RepID=UPI003AB4AFCC
MNHPFLDSMSGHCIFSPSLRLQYVSTCLSRIYNLDIRILHIHNVHAKRHVTRSRQRRVDCVEHFKTLFKPEVLPKLMWKNAAKVLGLEISEGD